MQNGNFKVIAFDSEMIFDFKQRIETIKGIPI